MGRIERHVVVKAKKKKKMFFYSFRNGNFKN